MGEELLEPAGVDPKVGMVLQDRYRIVRKIGEGGMGSVYEGEHVLIKRRVAIKCLHAQLANSKEIVARFHREALAATSIGHPNIVEVTDMGRFDDGTVFMVLELLEGRDWAADIEREGAQPIGRVVRIVEQICDGLGAAHRKGIIHRDLKPENVFLLDRGQNPDFVKILDFGISKFKDADGGKGMTQTGAAMGTPYYMSPEQAQGKKDIDHRSDIYSLGVMLFQALTGQYPFEGESYPMLVVKICMEPPPAPKMFRPDLPDALDRLILSMLSKDPVERPADCAAVRDALAPFRDLAGPAVIDRAAAQSAPTLPDHAYRPQKATTPEAFARTDVGISVAPTATPPRRSFFVAVGAAAAVAVAIGVAAASGAFRGDAPQVIAETAPPAAPATPASSATPLPEPAVPSAPEPPPVENVTVEIQTTPTEAELYLDGDRIPNPFDGELPKTDEARRLEARLDGYVTVVQDLVLRYPQRVRLRLRRGRGTDDRRAEGTPAPGRPVVAAPAPAPVVEPPPAAPAPVPVPAVPSPTEMRGLKKIF